MLLDCRLASLSLQLDFELWRVVLLDVYPRFVNALERADSSLSEVGGVCIVVVIVAFC